MTPGHMIGMITFQNACSRLQPSTKAASSRAAGILAKNERSIQMVKGWLMATSTTITAIRLPYKPQSIKKGR